MTTTYETDFYAWLNSTAEAVEKGRFSEIDRANLAEELRAMGRAERNGLRRQIERILIHLLKIRYQPEKHTRSWDRSIDDARLRIEEEIEDSPSLQRDVPALIARAYRHARIAAVDETGLPARTFPQECPFSLQDVFGGGNDQPGN